MEQISGINRSDGIEKFLAFRYTLDTEVRLEASVAREYPLTIVVNYVELATILCTPEDLDYLVAGFLFSEGFIKSKDQLKNILVNYQTGVVHVETTDDIQISQNTLTKRVLSTGCGRGAAFYSPADTGERVITTETKVSLVDIFTLVNGFQHASNTYRKTHGVHSAAICLGATILFLAEDVGRHNAVDKVFGRCLMEGVTTEGLIILTSGRISSEIVHKAAKKGVPVIISISAPTSLALRLARKLGITLIASVRGGKMDVFTHEARISR